MPCLAVIPPSVGVPSNPNQPAHHLILLSSTQPALSPSLAGVLRLAGPNRLPAVLRGHPGPSHRGPYQGPHMNAFCAPWPSSSGRAWCWPCGASKGPSSRTAGGCWTTRRKKRSGRSSGPRTWLVRRYQTHPRPHLAGFALGPCLSRPLSSLYLGPCECLSRPCPGPFIASI